MVEIDKEIVREALRKKQLGAKLTRREEGALRRFQKEEETRRGRDYCESVPQKHFCEMAGRQPKQIREQFERYGAPPLTATVSLTAVFRWLFRFLAENKLRLAAELTDDPLLAGTNSPALEEYRREQAIITRLKRLELEGKLVDLETIHVVLTIASARYRKLGEALQKKYGRSAHSMTEKAISDVERETSRLFTGLLDESSDDGARQVTANDRG